MKIGEIPFIKHLGIRESGDTLVMPSESFLENHVGTVHASAQFALAETSSGYALQQTFPDLAGNVIPLLRKAEIKFRKLSSATITAYPVIEQINVEKFRKQFARKGRATIAVAVELKDEADEVTATATYEWFIQRMEQSPA